MNILLVLTAVLIFVFIALMCSTCLGGRKSAEHYRMCAKLPSMTNSFLASLKLIFHHTTLKPTVLPSTEEYVVRALFERGDQGVRLSLLLFETASTDPQKLHFIKLMNHCSLEILPYFGKVLEQYGPVVYMKVMGFSYVFLNDPEDIKALLSSNQHINKGPEYSMLKPWLNKGLLTSGSSKWHSRRKLLTYTFHFKILETYIPSFNKHARLFAKELGKTVEGSRQVSIYPYMTLCALDIVCETIMGTELRSQEGKSIEYVGAINTVTDVMIKRILKFWLWNDYIFTMSQSGRDFKKSLKILHTFTENVIKEKREKLELVNALSTEEMNFGKKRVESFLDLLIGISKQNPKEMTDLDIREEVDTFLFEGHDTSSTAMSLTLIHLGLHQDIQDAVREELYSIFGDSDREATMGDLKSMMYLERVIKETIRLYPSVPSITRMLRQNLDLKNYQIPSKTVVGVFPYLLHRNEKIFPNPLTFDPDRFLPENSSSRHPYAYLPFSAGPRNCIGQKYVMCQMKTVISTVIRQMKIETLGSQEDIVMGAQLILRPESLPDIKITRLG